MPNQNTVLVVGPDSDWRSSKCAELAAEGFAVRVTNCTDEASRIFEAEVIAAVFVDAGYVGATRAGIAPDRADALLGSSLKTRGSLDSVPVL